MKCIAIKQPYASLIVSGVKTIENRTWASNYRGPLAIYASKALDKSLVNTERRFCKRYGLQFPTSLPASCIIGVVDLVGMMQSVTDEALADFDDGEGGLYQLIKSGDQLPDDLTWYADGNIGWILANPRPLPAPIPFSGRLGLFDIPDGLIIP